MQTKTSGDVEMCRRNAFTKSRVTALVAMLFVVALAHAASDSVANVYNFSYLTKGDRSVLPTQVFDNGSETFFQFSADKTVPAIFAVSPCGRRVLLTPNAQGPYLVGRGMYKNYALQLGTKNSTIDYSGDKEIPLDDALANEPSCAKRVAASYGAAQSSQEYGVARPKYGDGTSPRQLTTMRTPPESGSAASKLAPTPMSPVVATSKPSAPACPFSITPSDTKLSEVLERWATTAGYQLSFEIKGEEPAISMKASYCDKQFLEALDDVLGSYEDTSPMQAIVWRGNNGLQIVTGSR